MTVDEYAERLTKLKSEMYHFYRNQCDAVDKADFFALAVEMCINAIEATDKEFEEILEKVGDK